MKQINLRFFCSIVIAVCCVTNVVAQQQKYIAPALSDSNSWSIIMLPDPQTYQKFERNQPLFELMTAWISENIDKLNIQLVMCTGDLVEQNEMINPDGIAANQASKQQWASVARAFGRLDGKVPYVLAAGNHDYGYTNISVRRSNYNTYFPVDKNFKTQKLIREAGLNAEGIPTMENAAFEFASPQGRKFLLLTLEFAPRDTIIAWAKKVTGMEKYKNHTGVILTHSYLNSDNQQIVKENYPITDGNYGAAIWKKLVQPSTNIQLVFSGHIGEPDNAKGHVGFRTDKNAAGKKVNQMVFNAQAMGGGWYGNGGDGWLRILEFLPDGKTVKVKTFSPFFAISPTTQQFAWRTAPYDAFEFQMDK
ncbi:metallophosphoesterase [Agriterribacter sp.]|uniref:metallophosphoesterase n=1 Tax=Agriterribacter sp. TaxID=2821509 RepID=UPI002BE19C35|nr:metallophosphoesterase [Agriterribacter sp.]HTN06506.1 metallophosphoesterase [Agriterribacter sp.]